MSEDLSSDKPASVPPSQRAAAAADPATSPLSVKLQVATPREPIVLRAAGEREETAKARVGTRIKGWRLLRVLGIGPISSAYEVIHGEKDSGDRGVLRLLTSDLGKNERAKGQFLRAAYAANRFRHPRVVPIVADGTNDDGTPYVIRAFTDGKTLADAVREASAARTGEGEGEASATPHHMDASKVLRIMEQVLDALEIAHAHGVVHGDITPNNVIVTPRGSIRLVDFATPPGTSVVGQDVRDVLIDHRIGPFTAPERCAIPPDVATEQTDVWAVAACAYYALSGQYPRGESTHRADLATASPIPLREIVPTVAEPISQILDHALQKEPELRYGSAYAMLGDVRRALAGRRPKLGDALRPVPSGSYRDVSLPSSRRMGIPDAGPPRPAQAASSTSSASGPRTPESQAREAKRQREEWRGNLILIMAIALLVGVATFVVVRERMEDQRKPTPAEAK